MGDSARFFVAPRGARARTAQRALTTGFRVEAVTDRSGPRVFLDTFDQRLYRAGFVLAARADATVLEDRSTGEEVGSVVTVGGHAPRWARDFAGSDIDSRVADLIGPRALLEVARVTVKEHELELSRRDSVVARVRVQSARVRRGGRARSVHALAIIPVTGARRARESELRAVGDALVRARFRPSSRGFVDRVFAACGVRLRVISPRPQVTPAADAALRSVAAAIFAHLLGVMRRNEPGMRDDVDPEFLHDYRVALRRTRTGLSQLRETFAPEVAREYRARFERVAAATGRLRDLDVQLARRDEYAKAVPAPLRSGFEPVFAHLQAEREDAYEVLLGVLGHPSHGRLLRDWRRAVAELAGGSTVGVLADAPASDAARSLVRRRYARVRRAARRAEDLDDDALHRARIECKKLRYLLEFFAGVLGPGVADATASLAKVQDVLGEYNDVTTQMRALSAFVREDSQARVDSPLTAAAVGAIVGSLDARRRGLRSRCERRLAALDDRKSRRMFDRLLKTDG